MNPPIQSTPPERYQQSATPMYPLKPMEVPQMTHSTNSYLDGHRINAAVYPPTGPPQPPTG